MHRRTSSFCSSIRLLHHSCRRSSCRCRLVSMPPPMRMIELSSRFINKHIAFIAIDFRPYILPFQACKYFLPFLVLSTSYTWWLIKLICERWGSITLKWPAVGCASDDAIWMLVAGISNGQHNAHGSLFRTRKPWSVTVLTTGLPLGSLKDAVARHKLVIHTSCWLLH
jgi:hypothetical protein